ncbi:MAG: hypothetical protein OEO77_14870, partial [Acidimicrobiia bacterium]|nr:hypothetical protein [Acidimicrobiia bacterium]
IPLTSFEGRFTVGLLPFGSPPSPVADRPGAGSGRAGGTTRPPAGDDVPAYPGELADDGWRLAPVAPRDPAVTLWTADEVINAGHTPTYSVVASGDFGELAYLTHGVAFQKPVSPDSTGAVDDTIWIGRDGDSTPLVESSGDDDLVLLEDARFVDWGEDVVYYQVRSGTNPENTRSRLYGKNTLTGEVNEIAVIGGWESGVDFHDVNASYPLVAGMWRAEGFVGPVILNFETGGFEYHADEVGDSCFAGESGCPDYSVVTMIDGSLYGVRSTGSPMDSPTSQSLYRFDPSTGTETEVARFGWIDGLWYPRSIMAIGRSVVISVEGGDGEALPAAVVDLDSGDASTLSRPGFVAQSYLS